MLVQVVALLALGLLGSSAPLQEERSRTLVGLIIQELLQDIKKLNLNAVPSLVTVNATVERCMHSHLKTFTSTLTALDTHSKFIARKLTRLDTYRNILPKKETPRLLNETKYSLVDEMLCLLKAENRRIQEKFSIPVHIKERSCAHKTTEIFIHELKKIHKCPCMRRVEKDMEKLEKTCNILKKSSFNNNSCLKKANTGFSKFKESLEEFLRWVNEKLDCRKVGRGELGLYLDGECSCPDSWKSHQGLG
ncbi:uncharacterized protein LOC128815087 [Vidua macroura]|uniref:uncharacterized protein LOC128815087 n=1 Tax=Vidua macroura TaxID=187451 RepID=UPI0023A7B755|nr:uncharacterized protein LOC128815087 [Vidua macroura]